jgi:hypothetical protein
MKRMSGRSLGLFPSRNKAAPLTTPTTFHFTHSSTVFPYLSLGSRNKQNDGSEGGGGDSLRFVVRTERVLTSKS